MVLFIVGVLTIYVFGAGGERDGLPQGRLLRARALLDCRHDQGWPSPTTRWCSLRSKFCRLGLNLTGIRAAGSAPRRRRPLTLLGAFSSAFFLYGIAFTYGLTGSTRLDRVGTYVAAQSMNDNPLLVVALGLLLVGFAFKISAVPFHMWTPDAYEGAPAVVTGFMSTGVKAAAFAAFARVFLSAFELFSGEWAPMVWLLAAATMIPGTAVCAWPRA